MRRAQRGSIFAALAIVLSCSSPLGGQTTQVSQELLNEVVRSIALRGCDVFEGNEIRDPSALQECYASAQDNPDVAKLIKSTTANSITAATIIAAGIIRDVYKVQENFDWVLTHEGQLTYFEELASQREFKQIRKTYKSLQNHNGDARNLLSALSDSQINDLILGRSLENEYPTTSEMTNEPPISLTDRVAWAISYAGCLVFIGESLRTADELRKCYLTVEENNHNGEAVNQLISAPPELITSATRRAIAKIKELSDAKETFESYLIDSGLEQAKSLIKVGAFSELRLKFENSPYTDAAARYSLNAFADSEISAIVNRSRLSMLIPPGTSPDALASISDLLETRKVEITNTVVGSSQLCVLSVCWSVPTPRTVSETIESPVFPVIGVPTQVTLRSGVSTSTATTRFASVGIKSEDPKPAFLIQPEQDVALASETVKAYGDNGLRWFLYSIAADKVRNRDLQLTGEIHVGVVDAGVDPQHEALKPFFWELPVVFPKSKWKKGSIGYDYLTKLSDPTEELETESHGTHVTGLVTARALALWLPEFRSLKLEDHIKVYALKVAGKHGIPDFLYPTQALYESIPNGIHLFNLSLEGPESGILRDDINAQSQQALLILAAGNDGTDMNKDKTANGTFRNEDDGTPLGNVIIVGALMDMGTLTPRSNHGSLAVEIVAPGNSIYSTVSGGKYGSLTGTSQAAPLVTATAAILLAEHNAYPSQVKERILSTCDWDPALVSVVAEGCKLNMAKAITSKSDIIELNLPDDTNGADGPKSLRWLHGSVKTSLLQLKDDSGTTVDPSKLHRIWFLDQNGRVQVAIRGGGHKKAKLSSTKVVIELEDGEQCPGAVTTPCAVDPKQIRDVVFRWQG